MYSHRKRVADCSEHVPVSVCLCVTHSFATKQHRNYCLYALFIAYEVEVEIDKIQIRFTFTTILRGEMKVKRKIVSVQRSLCVPFFFDFFLF